MTNNTRHTHTNYQLAQETVARRRAEFDAAVAKLELARIRARLAEIEHQYEPLAGLLAPHDGYTARLADRDRIVKAAFYVVVGRFPA